jgi:hypothetical protein
MQKSAGGGDLPVGVDFDGTNDYLSRSSDLVGNADGKTFTFSAWVYHNPSTEQQTYLSAFQTGGSYYGINLRRKGNNNNYSLITGNVADNGANLNVEFNVVSTAAYSLDNTWMHISISVDLTNTANRHIYVDDEVPTYISWASYVNTDIDFTKDKWRIGRTAFDSEEMDGRLAGVYLDYTYRDLSVEANRRDFIDADGLYVTPPTSGIISVPMDDPDDVGRNDGTGGDFTLNGTVARSGRGPNQYNAVASEFDGVADRLNRSSQLTGESSTNAVTFNFNIRSLASPTNSELYVAARFGGPRIIFGFKSVNTFYVEISSDAGIRVRYTFPSAFILNKTYNVSFKLRSDNISLAQFYVNGELITATTSGTGTDSNFNQGGFSAYSVASQLTTRILSNSVVGTFWYDNVDIDLATENPFYDVETNKPKYLGESGELPTGSSPLIYLPLRADDAGNNLGTGGAFTVNSGPFVGARGASEFWARSAVGNGTNGYFNGNAGGASSTYSIAFAIKRAGTSGTKPIFNTGSSYDLFLDNQNLKLYASSGSLNWETNDNSITGNEWHTVLLSYTGSSYDLYIDGSVPSVFTTSAGAASFPFNNLNILYSGLFSSYANSSIGFFYGVSSYIDFSQEANRLKFVDAFGFPADLQPAIDAGDIPTPLIHMKFDDTSALGTNSGSGGDFTVNGTVTAGSDVKG